MRELSSNIIPAGDGYHFYTEWCLDDGTKFYIRQPPITGIIVRDENMNPTTDEFDRKFFRELFSGEMLIYKQDEEVIDGKETTEFYRRT